MNEQRTEEDVDIKAIRTDAAGVDLGSEEHWVCAVKADRTAREVARFGATTQQLEAMAEWLKERGVRSVAMESTGVYWVPVHEVLEAAGFEVVLADVKQFAHVPARLKTDHKDCRWIQQLHSCGMLKGAFRPTEKVVMLRTLVRDRARLVSEQGDWLRRMQKSLDQMNVRIHRAVSDLQGATGMAMVRAIVNGERDPLKLAGLRDHRCHKNAQEIAEQLRGHWRRDHLFSLAQSLRMFEAAGERIAAYDVEIKAYLEEMATEKGSPPPLANPNKERAIRTRGEAPLREALYRTCACDLTAIDTIGVRAAEVLISEYGPRLDRFPNEKAFVAHLRLAPRRGQSGGKPVRNRAARGSTRGAAVLRMAATSAQRTNSALGAYYRHIAQRRGADVAVFATARKLATLIFRMLRWGQAYHDEGAKAFEQRYAAARLHRLRTAAQRLGFALAPVDPNVPGHVTV